MIGRVARKTGASGGRLPVKIVDNGIPHGATTASDSLIAKQAIKLQHIGVACHHGDIETGVVDTQGLGQI